MGTQCCSTAVPGAPPGRELPSAALPIPAPTTGVIVDNRIMASTQLEAPVTPRKVRKTRKAAKGLRRRLGCSGRCCKQ
jgi:hypothetical protein